MTSPGVDVQVLPPTTLELVVEQSGSQVVEVIEIGPQGPLGPQGPEGPAGAERVYGTRHYGEGPPDAVLGARIGDEYVDALTGTLYRLE